MGDMIYGDSDPSDVLYVDTLYEILEHDGHYALTMRLPFITKEYVDLFKEDGDLVIRIGSFKRHVFLPRALVHRKPVKASLDNNMLSIVFPKDS